MPIQYMDKSIQDRDRRPGKRELFWFHSSGYTHNGMCQKYIDTSFYKVGVGRQSGGEISLEKGFK